MIARGVPLDEITATHLRSLIAEGTREGRADFKRDLPGSDARANEEFRADVSSFANAGGGDLVFGVLEAQGVAVALTPADVDADSVILRLEGILGSGIEPRILGVRTRAIPVDGGFVVIVRVPASWTGPHAVRVNESYRFFSRRSAAKYRLDIAEIRELFLAVDGAESRIRSWQAERIGRIVARETPVRLREGPVLVLHISPLARQRLSPAALEGTGVLQPIGSQTNSTRWNVDGLLGFAEALPDRPVGYAQVFRDGRYEEPQAYFGSPTVGIWLAFSLKARSSGASRKHFARCRSLARNLRSLCTRPSSARSISNLSYLAISPA